MTGAQEEKSHLHHPQPGTQIFYEEEGENSFEMKALADQVEMRQWQMSYWIYACTDDFTDGKLRVCKSSSNAVRKSFEAGTLPLVQFAAELEHIRADFFPDQGWSNQWTPEVDKTERGKVREEKRRLATDRFFHIINEGIEKGRFSKRIAIRRTNGVGAVADSDFIITTVAGGKVVTFSICIESSGDRAITARARDAHRGNKRVYVVVLRAKSDEDIADQVIRGISTQLGIEIGSLTASKLPPR